MGSSSDGDRPWQSYHTVYTNAKAGHVISFADCALRDVISRNFKMGNKEVVVLMFKKDGERPMEHAIWREYGMDGVDKEKVQRIVYEMSKGSKYFENEQRKDAYIKQKIGSLHAHCAKLTEKETSHYQKLADGRIMELEAGRDLSKVWLHSDMDAFYAAVETLEDPSLQGKPLAVGSMSMICTANYEARKYGVRAAMPGFIARKLCPDLIFVPTKFEKYTYYSELTRKVFRKYDPSFIATSLDEAYLNITDICRERSISGGEVAEELRNSIHKETGLTCSAGVAPNRLLAKVCSDINKPNGQYILPNDRRAVMAFISSLPIRKIGGIGKVTEHLLREVLGINNCEEMLQKRALICALFSRSSSDFFLSAALGLGQTETPEFKCRKSISCERTFAATSVPTLLFQKLEEICESLSDDMQKECLQGRTLTLKLKTSSFEVRTRAVSMQRYFHSKEDILTHGIKLLKAELPLSLRLIGLRISHFEDDKNVPNDPAQKTITSFIASGDVSHCLMSGDHSDFSDANGNSDILDINFDLNDCDSGCFSSDMHSKSMQCPKNGLADHEKVNETGRSFNPEVIYVSEERREELVWLEGYICSVCGVELPPSFHEERQEHSDYHMAEILQEDENKARSVDLWKHRNAKEKMQMGGRARKRPKRSPCSSKHLPIDSFFIKSRRSE